MTEVGDAIAIVGLGCRYPDASDPDRLWEMVLSRRRVFRRIPSERLSSEDYHDAGNGAPDKTYLRFAAVLDGWSFDRARYRVPGPTYRVTDLTHWLALDVAAETLASTGLLEDPGFDRERAGVIIGNTLTGEFSRSGLMRLRWPYVRRVLGHALSGAGWDGEALGGLMGEIERLYKEPFPDPTDESLVGGLANAIAGRICNHFDLRGGGYTVDGACSSSLLAVSSACASLVSGDLDFALAGGVDLSLDPFEVVGFARTGALATSAMRIYDERPTGFFPGEGCGMVALMRVDDAIAQGLTPLALIRGWGMSSDGQGGLTRPEKSGQLIALRRAYARAGFGPETVALFEGHGTGTPVGDEAELGALIAVQQESRRGLPPAALGSIKGNIGHTKAAAGVAGLIKATMALQRQVIPPTTGCEEPHQLLHASDAPVRVVDEAEPWPDSPLRAAVSAMGFGGINTHIVLEAMAPRRAPRLSARERRIAGRHLGTEVFAFTADSADQMAATLERAALRAETMSFAEHVDLAASLARSAEQAGRPVRAAIVARDPEQLVRRARRAGELLAGLGPRSFAAAQGVYVGSGVPGRVGLLFPGQGAPVPAQAGALGLVLPEAEDCFDKKAADAGEVADTSIAQPAIFRASIAGLRWLTRLGVDASAAMGHSLGEITALCWAGALSEKDALDLVSARGRIMGEAGQAGTGMASIAASPAVVVGLVNGTDLVVAADNGAAQVVAGSLDDIDRVLDRARSSGVVAHRLKVSHAFHSPAVAAAEPALAEYLADVPINGFGRQVYSTIDGRELTPAKDIRWMLAQQVTGPVHFREALERLASECDLLVEVGPGHSLTSMATSVTDVPVVALDTGAESADALCDATAALFAAGAVTDLDGLFARRFQRPFDLWRDPEFLTNPCERAPYLAGPVAGGVTPAAAPLAAPDAPGTADVTAPTEPALVPTAGESGDVGSVVRRLVAEALELTLDAVDDGDRLLADLHLNSLRVTQLAARAAAVCGRAVPVVPLSFADSSVHDLIEAIETLPGAGDDDVEAGIVPGAADWHRVLIPEFRPVDPAPESVAPVWKVYGDGPLRAAVEPRLGGASDGGPAIVVFLPEDPGDETIRALIEASYAATETQSPLTVVDLGDTASGYLGTIAQEYPRLPVRWIRAMTVDTAGAVADALRRPWEGHEEIVIDKAGRTCAVGYRTAPPAGPADAPPLAAGDVLLVTGGGKGIGLESAAFLAGRWGVRLGLLGRSEPDGDEELRANLARLREAGITFRYEPADVTDTESVRRAVAAITRELGPVAGVIHSSGLNRPGRFADLDPDAYARHAAPKHHGLRTLLDALDVRALRILITYGSVIGRFGLPGEAHYALANGRMRELARVLARDLPGCMVCNVDWTAWSGAGMGERLDVLDGLVRSGVVPLPADRGVELLARLAETPSREYSVVATGRLPQLARADQGSSEGYRFLRRVRSHTPGIELVAEADLSALDDPYLADHRIDGLQVLPAVCALEAMAQAATALTGMRPAGVAGGRFDRPVIIPDDGARIVRICALVREDGDVDVVIRSDETGFVVDHFSGTVTAERALPPDVRPKRSDVPEHDGGRLYGPLFFHGPLFQRLRRYEHLEAVGCTAVLAGDRSEEWPFGAGLPGGLRFGDPARNDASIHVLQACVPQRRLLPVGCDRFTVYPDAAGTDGLTLSASERAHTGADYTYDVVLRDPAGRPAVSWTGLRLRDVGALAGMRHWPALLLRPYLQRSLSALIPGSDVRLDVSPGEAIDRTTGRGQNGAHGADGRPLTVDGTAWSRSRVDGLLLTASSSRSVACDWEWVADAAGVEDLRRVIPWTAQVDELTRLTNEPEERVYARLWTVQECLSKTGRTPMGPLVIQGVYEDGWVSMRAGEDSVVSGVLSIEPANRPVAIAVVVKES